MEYCALLGIDLVDQFGRENMIGSKQVLCVSYNHSSHLQSKGFGAQPPHSKDQKWAINQAISVIWGGELIIHKGGQSIKQSSADNYVINQMRMSPFSIGKGMAITHTQYNHK